MNTKSTREHLLDVGVELMHQNGYNATGLSDILKAADLPKARSITTSAARRTLPRPRSPDMSLTRESMRQAVLNDLKMSPLKRLKRSFSDLTMTYGQMREIAIQKAPLTTPSDIDAKAVTDISGGLNAFLADVFSLCMKTKNFHWHMSGPDFRWYHLLLDDHGDQLFAMTDEIAERVRKIGGITIRSIGHIARLQRILDSDADFVTPADMLSELREDEKALTLSMREVHTLCGDEADVATTSLLENWINQSQRRSWFLFESTRA